MQRDRASIDKLAVSVAPLFARAQADKMQDLLESSGGELSGRLMVTDASGKVQADSFSELNGSRLELPEVAGILSLGKTADYGVHKLNDDSPEFNFWRFLKPYDPNAEWVGYCASALTSGGKTIGVLLFSTPIQDMMQQLFELQNRMSVYFIIAAAAALIASLFFSRIITRPIASLTRSIKRMARGDFSVRVPVRGSGELRKLSEAFNAMSEKLEMLDRSRNQFVSNASHELKTPLATMKILLESIVYQPDMDTDTRTEFLVDINKEIDRLNLIIGDLLTLVSMDSKTMRLNRTSFGFAQLVEEAVQHMSLMAHQRNQEIKLQISDRCEMYADRAKLTQVVTNLLDNAVKYTQEGGAIRVRLIRSGHDAILSVADNGPGIPKADQSHIFDRFYRVDKARSRDTGGTGLGLSIVHQMVLMHGGAISVDSEEGQGTTFTVELPVHQS